MGPGEVSGVDIGQRLVWVGVGRGTRELDRVVDHRLDLELEGLHSLEADRFVLGEYGAQPGDRVAFLPGCLLVAFPVAARIAAAVADEAVEFARASPDADPNEALTDVYA